MLHLEALESRCLLSNNSGLFVLAEIAQAGPEEMAQLTVTDTQGNTPEDLTDGKIDFGNVPLGSTSTLYDVTLTNDTDTPLTISGFDVQGDGFYLGYDLPETNPVGFSEVQSLEILPYDNTYQSYGENGAVNWFTFEAHEVRTVTFGNSSMNYGKVAVYNSYGQLVATGEADELFAAYVLGVNDGPAPELDAEPFTFDTTCLGTYYIELIRGGGNYYIDSVDAGTFISNYIPADNDRTVGHDEDSRFYSVTIEAPTRLSGTVDLGLTERFRYGSMDSIVELYNDPLQRERYLPNSGNTTLSVYNESGYEVFHYNYDYNSLASNFNALIVDDSDINAEETFFQETFDFDLLQAGTYTFVYTQDAEDADYYDTTQVEFDFTTDGSLLTLDKDESISIPVVFKPEAASSAEGSFNLTYTDSEYTADATVSLQGVGIAGDLMIETSDIQATYPEYMQSDTNAVFKTEIFNAGPGLVLSNSSIRFYLSTDEIFDKEQDSLLILSDGSEQVDLGSFTLYEQIEFLTTLDIPELAPDTYYIFTELVQSDVEMTEATDITSTEVIVNSYHAIVEQSQVNIDSNTSIVTSTEFATGADGIGNSLEFGSTTIASETAEYLKFFNRSDTDVKITDVQLATGIHYRASLSANGSGIPEEGVVISPGQYQRIYVYFDPQFFESENTVLSDVITVTTEIPDENADDGFSVEALYKVSMTGSVTGSDLIVIETNGEPNDDTIVIPSTRPGFTSDPVTITLTNSGNDPLFVNDFDFLNPQAPFKVVSAADGTEFTTGITINPGQEVDVNILFKPVSVGPADGVLVIRSTDPANDFQYRINISAQGVNPVVRIYEDSAVENDNAISYGTYGTVKAVEPVEEIILHNIGTDTLYISDISFANSNPDDFVILEDLFGDSSIIEVGPGEQMPFHVLFAIDQVGNYSDKLSITSRDSVQVINFGGAIEESVVSVTHTKNGVGVDIDPEDGYDLAPLEDIAVNSLINPAIDASKVEVFSYTNKGHSPIRVDTLSITNSGFNLLSSGNEPAQSIDMEGKILNPGEKIFINVIFDAYYGSEYLPDQLHTATVTIDGSVPTQFDVVCDVITPEIDLDTYDVSFGETLIGQKSVQDVTIYNDGSSDLTITGYESTDIQFHVDNSNIVVAPGESAVLKLVYEPDNIESTDAVITLHTSDLDESDVAINVSGLSAGNILTPTNVSGNTYKYVFNNSVGDRVKLNIRYVVDTDAQVNAEEMDLYPKVYLDASNDSGNISKIEMPGSALGSSITVSGEVDIYSITAGSLNSIKAPNSDLVKDIYLSGSLSSVQFDNIAAASSITVMANAKDLSFKANTIAENTVFDFNTDVKTFQANSFDSGSLTVNSINSLKIKAGDLGADLISFGDIKSVKVGGDIDGDIRALYSVGKIQAGGDISDNFIIAGDSSIENTTRDFSYGSIGQIKAGGDISANIMAADDIDKIMAAKGSMAGHVRAQNIKSINVGNIDDAVISAADNINSVKVKYDISDSFLLGGYDIGLAFSVDELNTYQDDTFAGGSIGKIKFGGQFSDSYVTAGAMPSFALDALYGFSLSGGTDQSAGASDIGSIKGNLVDTSSDSGSTFGFYASGSIKTNLLGGNDFQVVESF